MLSKPSPPKPIIAGVVLLMLIPLFAAGAAAQQAPVAAYAFNEGAGTALADSSGNGNAGTLAGPAWTAQGRYGGALSFDGVNDWVTVADAPSLDLSNALTLEAWVYPLTTSGWDTVVLKETPSNLAYALYANTASNRPSGEVANPGNIAATGTSRLSSNVWTHLALTYDDSSLRLYVNGVLRRTISTNGPVTASAGPLRIGGNAVWGEYFNGRIDDVRIYNRALSAAEVQSDMNTPISTLPPDTTPPALSGVQAGGVTDTSATISWVTDESATSEVRYGTSPTALSLSSTLTGSRTAHSVPLSGLSPLTEHFYQATSCDGAGNCASSSTLSFTTTAPVDSAPPVLSNLLPSGPQPAGTASVTLQATTDEDATCRYAASPSTPYGSMTDAFATTGTTAHATPVPTADGQSYSYYVRCIDAAGNANTASALISFSVALPPDTTRPAVALTAPLDGATVSGTVAVAADATDDVGVAGVQFLLDGAPLGAEDTTAPYGVSWSTGIVPNGAHTLSATARDAAGNLDTATVSVTVDNGELDLQPPSVPQGLLAHVISTSQINLVWSASTDNVGVAGYRVRRDGALVATVSTTAYKDTGLGEGTQHAYQIEAFDAAGNPSPLSTSATATTMAVRGSSLNVAHFHAPQYDAQGRLVPWLIDAAGPFDTILSLHGSWWLNAPSVNGWPTYLTAAELSRDYSQVPNGAVPGSTNSMAIDAYLDYYAYTGDARYLAMVRTIGDYILQQGLTPADYAAYPSFPWPVGGTGDITPDGSGQFANVVGEVMPDKGAMVAYALLKLYKATGDARYRDAAVHIANVLADRAVPGTATQSPWPFRAMGNSGATIDGPLSGNQVFALRLYDELLRLGIPGNGKYQATRDNVWNWLKTVAIADTTGSKWLHFFEDHFGTENNPTQIGALETARYLLEKRDAVDAEWFSLANSIINTVKSEWVVHAGDYTAIGEQASDMSAYNSHTARYASILALFYEAGGPSEYKDEAYSSLAYSAYSIDDDGFSDTYYGLDIAWTTDSWGDQKKHFLAALGAVPEWAPSNANHILRSSSVIQSASYAPDAVQYTAFDPAGTEKLKLAFAPFSVTVDGAPVSSWSWDPASQVLTIARSAGRTVVVSSGPDVAPPARSSGSPSGTLLAGTTATTLSLATSEAATCRFSTVSGTAYSAMTDAFATTGGTAHATPVSGLSDGASYAFHVRCIDAAGNANEDDFTISFSVGLPDTVPPSISAVSATAIGAASATISWSTDEAATSRVEYGTTAAYGQETPLDQTLVASHSQQLTGLQPGTLYHYRVHSSDASGNPSVSADAVFTTPSIDTTGLVAAYAFNEGAGTALADSSGNNNAGTLAGPAWTAQGRYGGALSFDGVNDWVTIADAPSLDLSNTITMMAWVNPAALANDWKTVVMKERSGGLAYALYASDGASQPPSLVLNIGGWDRTTRAPSNLPLNQWSHLAATYDGSTVRIYVDGTLVGSAAQTGAFATSTSPLRIGGNAVWGEYFNGRIDDVRIYNRALSAAEVQQNMNAPI